MKKLFTVALLFALAFTDIHGQSRTFEGIRKYRSAGSGPILETDKLIGYYSFLEFDKADKKNSHFELTFMDDNLNEVKKIDVIRPKSDYLVETVFNGSNFVCVFFNPKNGLDFISYDRSGKQTGIVKEEDVPKFEKYRIMQAQQEEDGVANSTVFPVGPDGFVRQSFTKNEKLGYEITAWDNNLKQKWVFASDVKSRMLETADIAYSSERYIALNVARKATLMTKKYDAFLILLDAATGKQLFEKPLKDQNELTLLGLFVDEKANDMIAFGEYHPIGEEVFKSKSEGVYAWHMDLQGKEIKKSKMGWMTDIRKILKTDAGVDATEKDNTRAMFHKIYRTKDGSIFAIGEQYKKAADGVGIAAAALGGGASVVKMNIMNMVTLKLNKDLTLAEYTIFAKKKTSVGLPQGYGSVNSTMLAAYIRTIGGFDYSFTSSESDRDRYVSVYQDYDRKGEDGKKADLMLGTLKCENGKMTCERVPFNTDADYFSINPAKTGYVQITEYYRKKKMLAMRLEKLTY